MFKIYTIICVVLFLALMPEKAVFACKCVMDKTERNDFDSADYVAHIKVIATELRDDKIENPAIELFDIKNGSTEYVRISFKEMEIFKGAKFSPKYLTELPKANGNCMIGLLSGQEYIVFIVKKLNGVCYRLLRYF